MDNFFVPKRKMDDKSFMKEIRNCLAHVNFDLYYDKDTDTYYVELENGSIKGKMTLDDLEDIVAHYFFLNTCLGSKKICFLGYKNLTDTDIYNKDSMDEALKKIKIGEITSNRVGDNLYLFVNKSAEDSVQNIRDLSEEEMTAFKNYLNYYGVERWVKLSEREKTMIFATIVDFIPKGDVDFTVPITKSFYRTVLKGEVPLEYVIQAPLIYTNILCNYLFFCMNFLKHTFSKTEEQHNIFNDLDLSDINIDDYFSLGSSEYIESLNNKIDDALRNIEKFIIQINNINNNDSMQVERKTEVLNNIRAKKKELEVKISIFNKSKKEKKSISIIDGLRNSITHGYYKFDYNSGLKCSDLKKMMVEFYDVNEKTGVTTFRLKISVEELLKLFSKIEDKLKKYSHKLLNVNCYTNNAMISQVYGIKKLILNDDNEDNMYSCGDSSLNNKIKKS